MDSFIGWIGGKKLLRKEIIARFPKEVPTTYVEVCGGAGWVLFGKDKLTKQVEVFNDIDSNLINLFRCVQHHPEALIKELEYIIPSREFFGDFKQQINSRGLTDIQRAARYFYLIKDSYGSKKEAFSTCPKSFDRTFEHFPDIQSRLKGVIIENKSYDDLIRLYDSDNTLFYIDPPYHGTEKYYKSNGHPFTEDDHYKLCECLKHIKGKFILSYNDDEFVRNLYKDYNIDGVTRNNSLASINVNKKPYAEVIIKNY